MEAHPLREEHAEHQATQELLPWFATGSLEEAESRQVERHLRDCRQCRNDLALQRRLREDAAGLSGPDADLAWQRMRSRLSADAGHAPSPARNVRGPSWMHWTLAGAAALVALLAIVPTSLAPRYHGLGRAGDTEGDIVVSFRPDTSERELRQILRQSGARIADGPTAANAYVLRVERGKQEGALVALRREPNVTMAEPLGPRGGP